MNYDDGEYFYVGYFVAPKNFSWYYAHLTGSDDVRYEIALPTDLALEKLREKATQFVNTDMLPNIPA